MSRIAKSPVTIPSGVDINISDEGITVKGSKGTLQLALHNFVTVEQSDDSLRVSPKSDEKNQWAMAGTFRALISNMVTGVTTGFSKKLQLVGVGYRAQVKGTVLNLNLGFSHPVDYGIPEDITVETPSQTEIVVSGSDKQKVGQVAAEIHAFRPPEPYKGKGVRYADEHVLRKEAKKK
ncbi:50S ribosomal protein L6 [Candidatus Vondammii sp. HM_W22]|uniref:50S ribosomal protein L6 n=1 Tax=Candidatus Vondammii sp. HM_W22 TaxID=2687299 RepID=UPI001F145694|nr:50S ribosomal protein L6 [Candidatus Vondammii sp. HM_W22]